MLSKLHWCKVALHAALLDELCQVAYRRGTPCLGFEGGLLGSNGGIKINSSHLQLLSQYGALQETVSARESPGVLFVSVSVSVSGECMLHREGGGYCVSCAIAPWVLFARGVVTVSHCYLVATTGSASWAIHHLHQPPRQRGTHMYSLSTAWQPSLCGFDASHTLD